MTLRAMAATCGRLLLSPLRTLAWKAIKSWVRWCFPSVERLSTASLAERLAREEQIVLIDARSPQEYAVSHLPGALRADSVEAVRQAGVGKQDTVVAYCSIGYRSARLVEQLAVAGYWAVNLEGSLFEWANENRLLLRAGQRTAQVHAYSATWALLLSSFGSDECVLDGFDDG